MLHAVQYRSMQTAIHHLALFDDVIAAQSAFEGLKESQAIEDPDEYNFTVEMCMSKCINDIEINFRNVPSEYDGQALDIINEFQKIDLY